jgi:hypothetical protein
VCKRESRLATGELVQGIPVQVGVAAEDGRPLERIRRPIMAGGPFAMGSHKTNHLGRYLTARLIAEGFGVALVSHRHSREAVFRRRSTT